MRHQLSRVEVRRFGLPLGAALQTILPVRINIRRE